MTGQSSSPRSRVRLVQHSRRTDPIHSETDSLLTTHSRRLSQHFIEALVSNGSVQDFEFDQILPPHLREIADIHWSPVEVARKIALVLGRRPGTRFIDIGAGPGKLCLLLALLTDLTISGIEQRKELVDVARQLCEANAPDRVRLIHGNMLTLDWDQFDVFYMFNPFQEHVTTRDEIEMIDRKIQMTKKLYAKYVDEVLRQIGLLKHGKMVITFHGYGGKLPSSLRLLESFEIDNGTLDIWEKV